MSLRARPAQMALSVCGAWVPTRTHCTVSPTASASAPGTGWRSPHSPSLPRPRPLHGHLEPGRVRRVSSFPPAPPPALAPWPHLGAGSGPGLPRLGTAAALASRSRSWGAGGAQQAWGPQPGQGPPGLWARPQQGWGQGSLRGTHSFRKVLTATAARWGATRSTVASARWPCSCRKRHEEATATRSHVPAN